MNKEETINKMKKGCLMIGIICCLIAAFLCLCSFSTYLTYRSQVRIYTDGAVTSIPDYIDQFVHMLNALTEIISAIVMIIAAIMFFYISKTGIPFTSKTMNMVRAIAVTHFLKAVVPFLIPVIIVGYHSEFIPWLITSSPVYLLMGVLFLCMSYIVKYGAQLQQESDETL